MTLRYTVSGDGSLEDGMKVSNRGEYGLLEDSFGNMYIAEGQIFILTKEGSEIKRINLPERPLSITLGGEDSKTLFVTTNSSLYAVRL